MERKDGLIALGLIVIGPQKFGKYFFYGIFQARGAINLGPNLGPTGAPEETPMHWGKAGASETPAKQALLHSRSVIKPPR